MATVRSAVADPLLPIFDIRSPDVFVCVATVLLVTSTLIEHVLPAPSRSPLNAIVLPPSGALTEPSQVVEAFAGLAIVTPVGRESVKLKLLTGSLFAELSIVKVSELTLPGPMVAGEKALLSPIGELTVSVSVAVPLLPDDDVRSPVVFT